MKKWLSTAAWMIALVLLLLSHSTIVNAYGTEVTGSVSFSVFNVAVSSISSSVAVITWDTNYDSTSQVYYGTSAGGYTNWTSISNSNPGVSHHSVFLSGLSASTTYHYQAQSTINNFTTISYSEDLTFVTQWDGSPVNGGGGGGGGPNAGGLILTSGGLISSGSLSLTSTGVAQNNVQLETQDHAAQLSISSGSILLDVNNRPLTQINAAPIITLPASPPDGIAVLAYEFGPEGARFDPPINLTLNYEAAGVPGNTPGELMHILFWDGAQWVEISSSVDTSAHTISAKLSHFSIYVLMKDIMRPSPAPTGTEPASATPMIVLAPPMPPAIMPGFAPGMSSRPTPRISPLAPAFSTPVASRAARPSPSRPESTSPAASNQSSSISKPILISVWVFVVIAAAAAVLVLRRDKAG